MKELLHHVPGAWVNFHNLEFILGFILTRIDFNSKNIVTPPKALVVSTIHCVQLIQ